MPPGRKPPEKRKRKKDEEAFRKGIPDLRVMAREQCEQWLVPKRFAPVSARFADATPVPA